MRRPDALQSGESERLDTLADGRVLPLIFLGPSLSRARAKELCRGEYRPPIQRGDLPRFAGGGPRLIGIVDGVFHQSLTVSPNEILTAMEDGHQLFGAASMGALRAVELTQAGMIGIGRVYEAFATGQTERDDEVAVVFDPRTGHPLSEALIGMRVSLQEAMLRGLFSEGEAHEAIQIAEEIHYPLRTYPYLLERLGLPYPRREEVLRFLREEATDLKAEDARALLRHISCLAGGDDDSRPTPSRRPPFTKMAPRSNPPPRHPALEKLKPAPKVAGWTSVRAVPAAETNAVLARVSSRFGVTRVAEITQLDRLGVPCYSAIWPGTGISAYSGKALDRIEARVGAQMEALEAALSQDDTGVQVLRARYEQVAKAARP